MRRIGWHVAGPLPVISGLVVQDVTDESFTVTFATDVGTRAHVEYGTDTSYGSESLRSQSKAHSITVDGLTEGTHHARVVVRGRSGFTRSDDLVIEVTPGGGPLILSGPTASLITETTLTVDWACDVGCTGQVFYGTTPGGPYPFATTRESSFTWSAHSQNITGLTAAQTYYGYVESTNAGGGTTQSDEFSWTMLGGGPEPSGLVLGGGITMTGLANVIVGRDASGTYAGPVHAQQFRAERSLVVDTLRYYRKAGASGYADGNGGTYEWFIVGTSGGAVPDINGTRYGYATKATPNTNTPGDLVTFGSKVALVAGTLYWVVMRKVGSVGSNYVSWNGMNPQIDLTHVPRHHPRWPNDDCNHKGGNGSSWGEQYGAATLSCHQLVYSDGHAQGNSYMEHGVSTSNGNTGITSSTFVRQILQPYATVTAFGVGVRAQHTSGGTLSAILKTSGGSTLQTATFAAARFPSGSSTSGSGARWDEAMFGDPQELAANTIYHLWLQADSGTFSVCNIRKGSVGFSYSDRTEFPRGHAQRSTNGGSSWSNIGSSNMDLAAYLLL